MLVTTGMAAQRRLHSETPVAGDFETSQQPSLRHPGVTSIEGLMVLTWYGPDSVWSLLGTVLTWSSSLGMILTYSVWSSFGLMVLT